MKPWNRVRAWVLASRLERELTEEMDAHRQMLEDQFLRQGLAPADARLAAARRFGNRSASLERSREQWRVRWIDSIAQDVRFALRLIRRQPLLTVAAVVTIALGVGANTAVTSVLQTALLNPLGLRDADTVVVAGVSIEKLHFRNIETSAVEFREIQAMRDTFSAAASTEGRWWTWEDQGEAMRLVGRAVTPDFFGVFNERPALGRFFTGDDRQSLVLSYSLWHSRFGGDVSAIGRSVMLDGKPYRIVGVAPEHFRVPANAEAWTPLDLSGRDYQRRGYNMMETVVARLKPGVTFAQATGRVNRYVAGLLGSNGGRDIGYEGYGYSIGLRPFGDYVAGDLRRPLLLVWIAALLVLVTGCANVAGLLLARSTGRKREIAIRFSLGASGLQVLRQLLVESLVLGAAGGAAGIALAAGGVHLAHHVAIPGGLMLTLVRLDARLIAYALGVSVATALLFGLAPALQLLRQDQSAGMARTRRRFQHVFVAAEVMAASMLLVITALLLRSLWAVERVQPGFDPDHLTTAFLLEPRNDPGFKDRLWRALRSRPGVEAAALAYPLPFTGGGLTSSFGIRNREHAPGEPELHGEAYLISPGYLRTLRIRLLRGRDFSESDSASAPTVCMIDAAFADRFFPGRDPLNQEIAMYKGWARIVGVVSTVRGTALEGLARPVVYYPLAQVPYFKQVTIVARSQAALVPVIRQTVRGVNASVPLFDIRTMRERIDESLGVRRLVVHLLAVFAAITILLSAVGLHSVVAQVVGERTPEIGIRMALGARPAQVMLQFLAQGLRAGIVGLVVGLGLAAYAQRWLSSLLYEIQPFDLATFSLASLGLLALLAFAVWWPARRASRIDPQAALRYE